MSKKTAKRGKWNRNLLNSLTTFNANFRKTYTSNEAFREFYDNLNTVKWNRIYCLDTRTMLYIHFPKKDEMMWEYTYPIVYADIYKKYNTFKAAELKYGQQVDKHISCDPLTLFDVKDEYVFLEPGPIPSGYQILYGIQEHLTIGARIFNFLKFWKWFKK